MPLFVLVLAYIVGVWIGSLLVWARLPGCDMPNWLSMVPLALLLFTSLLNGTPIVDDEPLRWPERAGFVRPRRGIPRGLVVAAALCVLAGGLRMAAAPQAGCWTPADLAAWNLPSAAAFDRDAPQVTVVGYISNFSTVDDDQQEVVVTVSRLRQGEQWHEVQGQARLPAAPRPRYLYGQPVEVTGRLATPPDFADFSCARCWRGAAFIATSTGRRLWRGVSQ